MQALSARLASALDFTAVIKAQQDVTTLEQIPWCLVVVTVLPIHQAIDQGL